MSISKNKEQNDNLLSRSSDHGKREAKFLPFPSMSSVHGAEDRNKPLNSLTVPTFLTSTYTFEDMGEVDKFLEGEIEREKYGRYGNPTQMVAEKKVANLEGAETALMFSSGMAAITSTLLALLKAGNHAVFVKDCYKRTQNFFGEMLPSLGINTTSVSAGGIEEVRGAIKNSTKLIFAESPTNPFLKVTDLLKLTEIGEDYNALTMIDSTFATPCNQRPLQFGADLVIHSGTKYLSGHNDLLAGFVVGSEDLVSKVEEVRAYLGSVPDPHTCYLLIRGLKTLGLRMSRQNESALKVARFLEDHSLVKRVYYPGLKSHPQYSVVRDQMKGYGGVVSFELEKGIKPFLKSLRIPYIASSFGGVESLIEPVAAMSYHSYSSEERKELGIKDNLIRFSAGIEESEQLIGDLQNALDSV